MYSPEVHLTEQLLNMVANLATEFPRWIGENCDLVEYLMATLDLYLEKVWGFVLMFWKESAGLQNQERITLDS